MRLGLKDKLFLNRYLLEICLRKHAHYFIKNKSLGDVVRTLPAISLYKAQYLKNKNTKIVVLTTENKAGLMAMNPDIDEVRILSARDLRMLQNYCLDRGDMGRLYRDKNDLHEMIPIYHLSKEFVVEHPELSKIPERFGKESVAKARDYLNEKGLDPQKTVLLVPYAASSSSLGPDILKPVADYYSSSGYRVLSNAFGNTHHEVEGAEPVRLPADVLLSVIQHGVTVIGVQCGLLDVCEWMHLTDKIIKVFVLKTEKDRFYHSNRTNNTDQKTEKKDWGYTIAVSSDRDYLDLADNIIRLGKELDVNM